MTGRYVKDVAVAVVMVAAVIMAMIVRPGSSPRERQGAGEKPRCDGKFNVFHIDSFCIS
jgi:hypothetical protein